MVGIGIVGLTLYLIFTFSTFNKFNRAASISKNNMGGIAILSMYIMGCEEAAGLTGGSVYYIYSLVILMFCNRKCEEKDNKLN